MKKYFLIKADTRDGEYEYSNISTLMRDIKKGKDITSAEVNKFAQDWFGFKDSYQEVRVRSFEEISKEDYEVLNKHGI